MDYAGREPTQTPIFAAPAEQGAQDAEVVPYVGLSPRRDFARPCLEERRAAAAGLAVTVMSSVGAAKTTPPIQDGAARFLALVKKARMRALPRRGMSRPFPRRKRPLQFGFDGHQQRRQRRMHGFPNDLEPNRAVDMPVDVAGVRDALPRQMILAMLHILADGARRLRDDFQAPDDGEVRALVRLESREIETGNETLDTKYVVADVLQGLPFAVRRHG